MSNYNPTYTYQRRDHEATRLAMEKYHKKQAKLKERGKSWGERLGVKLPKTIFITEVRPNPLSMELRIVLVYFWELYDDCLEGARQQRERQYPSETMAAKYDAEARETLATVENLCHELFAVTSPHAPFHIHSVYGCNDDDCPVWVQGYEAAKDDVLDWHTPDC